MKEYKNKKWISWVPDIIMAVVLLVIGVIMLYPVLYEIFVSFSDSVQFVRQRGIMLKSAGFTTLAYKIVLDAKPIWTGFRNTIFIEIVGLAFNLTLTSFGAYFLTRKNVLWKKPVNIMIIITMYFSGGLIPTYLTVSNCCPLLYNKLFYTDFPKIKKGPA